MIALSGVRISCDTFERNTVFELFALFAASSASSSAVCVFSSSLFALASCIFAVVKAFFAMFSFMSFINMSMAIVPINPIIMPPYACMKSYIVYGLVFCELMNVYEFTSLAFSDSMTLFMIDMSSGLFLASANPILLLLSVWLTVRSG